MRRLIAGAGALLGLLVVLGGSLVAQEVQLPASVTVGETLYEVRLADGSVIYGRVIAAEDDQVTFRTQTGVTLTVTRNQIRSIQILRGRIRGGEVWLDDPHATRLFFAPTGRTLSAGEGYLGVYELFFPFVTYGITDRVLITAGTPIIPEAIGQFAYVGPKISLINEGRVHLSIGAFAGLFDGGTAGLLYGVGTWGDRDDALTAGAGWGFYAANGEADLSSEPLFMIGGETRVGRRTKLLTENYFVLGEAGAVVSGGMRFFGENLSADAGIAAFVGEGYSCCLPVVNFVYSFGGR